MELYTRIIQELQHDLGLPISSFDDIGMSATGFLWELAQKDADNQVQQVAEEEYQTDRYQQEDSLTYMLRISEMIMILLIGSLMIMPIVKNLQTITIDLLRRVN
jgi:hypothetical protein